MTRSTCGVSSHNKHKKILKQAKGYYGARSKLYRTANQSVIKAGQYSYKDRKCKKRNFRSLWISRINAASRENKTTYSKLMFLLKKKCILINRKILSDIAINNKKYFYELIKY